MKKQLLTLMYESRTEEVSRDGIKWFKRYPLGTILTEIDTDNIQNMWLSYKDSLKDELEAYYSRGGMFTLYDIDDFKDFCFDNYKVSLDTVDVYELNLF